MLIHGLGNPGWNQCAMPQAECLALEVIIRVKQLAANGQDVQLHIAWAPHKMQFEGFDMSSSAPVTNGRADFMLVGSVGHSFRDVAYSCYVRVTYHGNMRQHYQ